MGTLFDLAPVRNRLGPAATEAWFERILDSAATVTLVGEFAKLGIDVDENDVLAQLRRPPPVDRARIALERE